MLETRGAGVSCDLAGTWGTARSAWRFQAERLGEAERPVWSQILAVWCRAPGLLRHQMRWPRCRSTSMKAGCLFSCVLGATQYFLDDPVTAVDTADGPVTGQDHIVVRHRDWFLSPVVQGPATRIGLYHLRQQTLKCFNFIWTGHRVFARRGYSCWKPPGLFPKQVQLCRLNFCACPSAGWGPDLHFSPTCLPHPGA